MYIRFAGTRNACGDSGVRVYGFTGIGEFSTGRARALHRFRANVLREYLIYNIKYNVILSYHNTHVIVSDVRGVIATAKTFYCRRTIIYAGQ